MRLFPTVVLMQLILLASTMSNVFVNTQTGRQVISMCGGAVHSCFVFDDKRMKCVGSKIAWGLSNTQADTYGASANDLGNNLPYINVGTGIGVEEVVCGSYHICMKLDTGDMKCLGDNSIVQIGIGVPSTTVKIGQVSGHIGDTLPVVNLGSGFKVNDISLGVFFSCALSTGGLVKCFGTNSYGQLGQGDTTNRGGSLSQMGDNLPSINLGTGYLASSIYAGIVSNHACAIISSPSNNAGRIKCWGYDSYSQLGYGGAPNYRGDAANEMGDNLPLVDLGTESRVKQLALGITSTCALLVTDMVKCWGLQSYGEFSIGQNTGTTPISSMGNLLQESILGENEKAKYIGAGRNHICIIFDHSWPTMSCAGYNNNGQLGIGDKTNRGNSPTTTFSYIPYIAFGNKPNITTMMVGEHHNCVVFGDLTVKCFGYNGQGQLALGDTNDRGDAPGEMGSSLPEVGLLPPVGAPTSSPTVPTKSPTYQPYTKVVTGSVIFMNVGQAQTCVVFDDKRVKCGGRQYMLGLTTDASYSLGDYSGNIGDNLPYLNIANIPSVDDVQCGYEHTCFRLDSGDIKCIGKNTFGQVGIGSTLDVIGVASGHVGDALPVVNLGTGITAYSLAIGKYHSCVLVTVNKVKCFGGNDYGQLGYGDQTYRGRSSAHMGDNLPFLNFGTNVQVSSVHSGFQAEFSCVIVLPLADYAGKIKCWGRNASSQLGYGDTSTRGDAGNEMGDYLPFVDLGTVSTVKQLAIGGDYTCAILVNDKSKCWGNGLYGQLASGSLNTLSSVGNSLPFVLIDSGKTVKMISAGDSFTCILYDDLVTLKCVGNNDLGQLGQGDTTIRGRTLPTLIPSIPAIDLGTAALQIQSIRNGGSYACVLFVDNSIKCFGYNGYGQFIAGSSASFGNDQGEMGVNLPFAQLFSPTASPTKVPTKNPTVSPTKRPSKGPSPTPTVAPVAPSTPSAASTNGLSQSIEIAIGVSVSALFVVAFGLGIYRYRNRTKAAAVKERPSSPGSDKITIRA